MATFTDTNGMAWDLTMTVNALKRVRTELGVDLGNLNEGDPPLSVRLQLDVVLLFDVIFCVLKPQAEKANVSDEEFAAALGGEAAMKASEAFWGSLIDFFRRFGRHDVVAQIQQQTKLVRQVVKQATDRINAVDLEEQTRAIAQNSGKPSTNGQGSSESTQDSSVPVNSPG